LHTTQLLYYNMYVVLLYERYFEANLSIDNIHNYESGVHVKLFHLISFWEIIVFTDFNVYIYILSSET